MVNPDWVTAICAVLGLISGGVMWFFKFSYNRMPEPTFQVGKVGGFFVDESQIEKLTITFNRMKYRYCCVDITADMPLFCDITRTHQDEIDGVSILNDNYQIELSHSFEFQPFDIASINQTLKNEKQITFYFQRKVKYHRIILTFSSAHFPFKWKKRIEI